MRTAKSVVESGAEVLGQGRTVITLSDYKLSTARDGQRCKTMPHKRDAVGEVRARPEK
ncbi:MAG: hypothetical protein HC897_00805 [Thermoanaerobaculia bacterium]|nr:hypothetical protein [Thermoanaerobaculia bacterium]